jgi:positive regulator of sigma E activity
MQNKYSIFLKTLLIIIGLFIFLIIAWWSTTVFGNENRIIIVIIAIIIGFLIAGIIIRVIKHKKLKELLKNQNNKNKDWLA